MSISFFANVLHLGDVIIKESWVKSTQELTAQFLQFLVKSKTISQKEV